MVRVEVDSYYKKNSITWLKEIITEDRPQSQAFPVRLYLDAPVRDEDVVQNKEAFVAFCQAWQKPISAGHVEFLEKSYGGGIGSVQVPIHLVFDNEEEISKWSGHLIEFRCAKERLRIIHQRIPRLFDSALKVITSISNLAPIDFDCLIGASEWILQNKDRQPVMIRQIPVRGLDTRWFEINRPLLLDFLQEELGLNPLRRDLRQFSMVPPPPLITICILDEVLRGKVGGLAVVSSTAAELARLQLRPLRVVLVDDAATAFSLPAIPGIIAVVLDRAHIPELAGVPWLSEARTMYIGPVETSSFAVLHVLRRHFPQVQNLNLSERFFTMYSDLWTFDEIRPLDYIPSGLTMDEARMCYDMREGCYGQGARLALERVPLEDVISCISGRQIEVQNTAPATAEHAAAATVVTAPPAADGEAQEAGA